MITGCNVLENEKGGLFKNFGIDFQSFGVGAKLYFISVLGTRDTVHSFILSVNNAE